MGRPFRKTAWRKAADRLLKAVAQVGITPGDLAVVVVRGRRSGREYSTPVNLVERDGALHLVAVYGVVSWVRNARAAGEVGLRRGRRRERYRIEELPADEAGPILRQYVEEVPFVRPYVGLDPDAPAEAFAAEARRRPVFALRQ